MKMTRGSIVQFRRLASIGDLTMTTTASVTVVMVIIFAVAVAAVVAAVVAVDMTVDMTIGTVSTANSIIRASVEASFPSGSCRGLSGAGIATTPASGHPRRWT